MPRGLLHQNERKGVLLPPWCSHQHRREGIAKLCPRTTPRTASPCRSRRRRVTRLKRGSTCRGQRPAPCRGHGPRHRRNQGRRLCSVRRALCAEGFIAIAFDYRNFGGSGGQPREALSVPRQREDYITVIGWAVEQPYVDRRQIIAMCSARRSTSFIVMPRPAA